MQELNLLDKSYDRHKEIVIEGNYGASQIKCFLINGCDFEDGDAQNPSPVQGRLS